MICPYFGQDFQPEYVFYFMMFFLFFFFPFRGHCRVRATCKLDVIYKVFVISTTPSP